MTTAEAIVELKVLQHQLKALLDDPHPEVDKWLKSCKRLCKQIAEAGEHV